MEEKKLWDLWDLPWSKTLPYIRFVMEIPKDPNYD
jgi:hypothetical protein